MIMIIARGEGEVRSARRCEGSVVGAYSYVCMPVSLCQHYIRRVAHLILSTLLICFTFLPSNHILPLSFRNLSTHLPNSQSVIRLRMTR